jgi:YidC/Oxa1 family membrane protein insertase
MDPKRIAIAVVISIGLFFLWSKFLGPGSQPPPPPPAPTVPQSASAPGAPAPAAPGAPTPAKPATERPAEESVILETPQARFTLSSWGASLRKVELKEKKFMIEEPGKPPRPYQLIGTTTPETAPLQVSFPKADFKKPDTSVWEVAQKTSELVVFRTSNDEVTVEKRYKLLGPHRLWLEVTVENRTDKPVEESLALHLFGRQNPETKGGGFFDSASASVTSMVCFINGEVERSNVESLLKEPSNKDGDVRWVAADDKYYVVAAVLPEDNAAPEKCGRRALDELNGEVFVSQPSRTIAAGGKTVHVFDVFAGPKYVNELEAVNANGGTANLEKVVDVTFAVLSGPLLKLLKFFQKGVGNWGLAIILLTLFVKLLTLWPAHKAMMSGKKMQRLAPKMQELRKKYENDKQKLQIETMNLYKREGVSPFLGGCLPSLLTMPIWIALFSTLNYAVELHRVPFFWYIRDLSAPDPYRVPLPLIMGAIMFLQMRMTPAGGDPQQQKMMPVMMPVMFTAFSFFLPAGLCIYTMTNSLLGIGHQLVVTRIDRKMSGPLPTVADDKEKGKAADKPAQAAAKAEGKGKGKGKHKGDKGGKG